jgi:5'-methylthioadenosine phosphorylase
VSAERPSIAVIGGSGLCRQDIFPVIERVRPRTAYGEASDEVSLCSYTDVTGADRVLAFLPRHAAEHVIAPHKVPYRANIAALRALGITQIIATCIAGSLRRRIRPGDLVVPDQFVDLTRGRDPDGPPSLIHLPMADPYCPRLRALCWATGNKSGLRAHRKGTVAVIQGPRFSTRAESRWFARQGWDLVNMTQYPECYLAREAGICYAAMAMITDYDVGVDGCQTRFATDVSIEPVLAVFRRNVSVLKSVIADIVPQLPLNGSCGCAQPLPPEYYKRLQASGLDVPGAP